MCQDGGAEFISASITQPPYHTLLYMDSAPFPQAARCPFVSLFLGTMVKVMDARCVLHAEPSLRKRTCARPPKYLRIPNALRLND